MVREVTRPGRSIRIYFVLDADILCKNGRHSRFLVARFREPFALCIDVLVDEDVGGLDSPATLVDCNELLIHTRSCIGFREEELGWQGRLFAAAFACRTARRALTNARQNDLGRHAVGGMRGQRRERQVSAQTLVVSMNETAWSNFNRVAFWGRSLDHTCSCM